MSHQRPTEAEILCQRGGHRIRKKLQNFIRKIRYGLKMVQVGVEIERAGLPVIEPRQIRERVWREGQLVARGKHADPAAARKVGQATAIPSLYCRMPSEHASCTNPGRLLWQGAGQLAHGFLIDMPRNRRGQISIAMLLVLPDEGGTVSQLPK
ncbi:Uncharacterised protein [Mycobacteroides abscessus subsp. abscessus]|nr:Uncharacterised protein [Mycobacteroides abscessus subsp. abscessus]